MRTEIRCPKCGRRVLDSDSSIRTLTKIINPYNAGPPRDRWKPDFYIKCWHCSTKVGIKRA